ncbi:MAG TPA: phosphatase PAP2 family protein, partial [Gemmataceae bacterium]
ALVYLLPALVALVFTLEAGLYMNFTAAHFPATCDARAYAVDGAFGFQPSFATGRLFAAQPWLMVLCAVIYFAPSPTLVFVYTLQVRAKRPPPVDVVTVLLVLVLVGYAFYFLFPVCGPGFAFGERFPNHPPPAGDVLAQPPPLAKPDAWRNGMPSLHFGSVLLGYWHARPFGRWAKLVAGVFVAGTFLATMGLGEHYLADLIVALPFTLMVQAACTPVRPRWLVFGGAAALTACWYAVLYDDGVLRYVPEFVWALTAVTVVAVVALERMLYRATATGAP